MTAVNKTSKRDAYKLRPEGEFYKDISKKQQRGLAGAMGANVVELAAEDRRPSKAEQLKALMNFQPGNRDVIFFKGRKAGKKREISPEKKQRFKKIKRERGIVEGEVYKITIGSNPLERLKETGMRAVRAVVKKGKKFVRGQRDKESEVVEVSRQLSAEQAGAYKAGTIDNLMNVAHEIEARDAEKYGKPLFEAIKSRVKNVVLGALNDAVISKVQKFVPKGLQKYVDKITPDEVPEKVSPVDIYREEYNAAKKLIDSSFEDIEKGNEGLIQHHEDRIVELKSREKEEGAKLNRIISQAEKAERNIKLLNDKKVELLNQLDEALSLEGMADLQQEIRGLDKAIMGEQKAVRRLSDLRSIQGEIKQHQLIIKHLKEEFVYVKSNVKEKADEQINKMEAQLLDLREDIGELKNRLEKNKKTIRSNADSVSPEELEGMMKLLQMRQDAISSKEQKAISIEKAIVAHRDALQYKVLKVEDAPYYEQKKHLNNARKAFRAQALILEKLEGEDPDKVPQAKLRGVQEKLIGLKEKKDKLGSLPEDVKKIKKTADKFHDLSKIKALKKPANKVKDFFNKAQGASKVHTISSGIKYAEYGTLGLISALDLAIQAFELKRHVNKALKHGVMNERTNALIKAWESPNEKLGKVPNIPGSKDDVFNKALADAVKEFGNDPDYRVAVRGSVEEHSHGLGRNIFKAAMDGLGMANAGFQIGAAAFFAAGLGASAAFPPVLGVLGGVSAGAMIGFTAYKMYKKVGHSDKLKAAHNELIKVKDDYQKLEQMNISKDSQIYKDKKSVLDDRALKCHETMMRYDPDYRISTLYNKLKAEAAAGMGVDLRSDHPSPTALLLQYLGVPADHIEAAIDAANSRAAIDLLKLDLGYKVKKARERDINPDDYRIAV